MNGLKAKIKNKKNLKKVKPFETKGSLLSIKKNKKDDNQKERNKNIVKNG